MPTFPPVLSTEGRAKIPTYMKIRHIVVAIIGGYFILDFGSDILVTFFVAMFLSFMLIPVSDFLEKKGFPKWMSIIISIFFAIFIIVLVISFFSYQLFSFQADLPELKAQSLIRYKEIQHFIETKFEFTRREQTIWIDKKISDITKNTSTYLMSALSTTGTFVANLALIPIYIFFITYYKSKILTFIYCLV